LPTYGVETPLRVVGKIVKAGNTSMLGGIGDEDVAGHH